MDDARIAEIRGRLVFELERGGYAADTPYVLVNPADIRALLDRVGELECKLAEAERERDAEREAHAETRQRQDAAHMMDDLAQIYVLESELQCANDMLEESKDETCMYRARAAEFWEEGGEIMDELTAANERNANLEALREAAVPLLNMGHFLMCALCIEHGEDHPKYIKARDEYATFKQALAALDAPKEQG